MTVRTATRNRRVTIAAALLALLAPLAACSSSDAPTAGAPARDPAAAPEAVDADGLSGAAGEENAAQGAPNAPVASVEQRSIVYNGSINIRVEAVVDAADHATTIATGSGGFVAGDTRTISDSGSQATLVLRVPADKFDSALDSLAKLGTEEGRQVNADDVTETLVDLDARIATQQASLARVRELLARATTIGEIVSLENDLTNRQATLDSLTQRREKLSGLVALATITVYFYGPTGPVDEEKPDTGFLAGLRGGWDGFLASVTAVLTVAGWLLPWAIAIGVPLWLILWVARRRRQRPVPPADQA